MRRKPIRGQISLVTSQLIDWLTSQFGCYSRVQSVRQLDNRPRTAPLRRLAGPRRRRRGDHRTGLATSCSLTPTSRTRSTSSRSPASPRCRRSPRCSIARATATSSPTRASATTTRSSSSPSSTAAATSQRGRPRGGSAHGGDPQQLPDQRRAQALHARDRDVRARPPRQPVRRQPIQRGRQAGALQLLEGPRAARCLQLPAETREGFLQWMLDYEDAHLREDRDGRGCYEALVEDWLRWYPSWVPKASGWRASRSQACSMTSCARRWASRRRRRRSRRRSTSSPSVPALDALPRLPQGPQPDQLLRQAPRQPARPRHRRTRRRASARRFARLTLQANPRRRGGFAAGGVLRGQGDHGGQLLLQLEPRVHLRALRAGELE